MTDTIDPLAPVRERVRAMGRDITSPVDDDDVSVGDIMAELDRLEQRIEESKRRVASDTRRHLDDLKVIHNANRLAMVGSLTAGMAQQFGSPLGVILARAQMIVGDDVDIADARRDAAFIVPEVQRMTQMCRDVLDAVRPGAPERVPLDVVQVITHALGLLNLDVRRRDVTIAFDDPPPPIMVLGDAARLTQVLTNVVINAAQAMPRGGTVHVRVLSQRMPPPTVEGLQDGEYVRVEVEDTGIGIPAADLEHLFETFFTTRPREGAGLGLAVSRRIMREHDGWIGVVTAEGVGSTFTLFLPLLKDGT